MCHLCETQKLCERLERQIKNIDAGGAVSLDAMRSIMVEAKDRLGNFVLAETIGDMINKGMIAKISLAEIVAGKMPGKPH